MYIDINVILHLIDILERLDPPVLDSLLIQGFTLLLLYLIL